MRIPIGIGWGRWCCATCAGFFEWWGSDGGPIPFAHTSIVSNQDTGSMGKCKLYHLIESAIFDRETELIYQVFVKILLYYSTWGAGANLRDT